MNIDQRAAYEALKARMAALGVPMVVGVPTSMQASPGAYLASVQIVFDEKFQTTRLRPVLTLAVSQQDATDSEWAIVDLVDLVMTDLGNAKLDGVCRCRMEGATYSWRLLGSVDHRVADIQMILSQL